jgi:hypothetical protein
MQYTLLRKDPLSLSLLSNYHYRESESNFNYSDKHLFIPGFSLYGSIRKAQYSMKFLSNLKYVSITDTLAYTFPKRNFKVSAFSLHQNSRNPLLPYSEESSDSGTIIYDHKSFFHHGGLLFRYNYFYDQWFLSLFGESWALRNPHVQSRSRSVTIYGVKGELYTGINYGNSYSGIRLRGEKLMGNRRNALEIVPPVFSTGLENRIEFSTGLTIQNILSYTTSYKVSQTSHIHASGNPEIVQTICKSHIEWNLEIKQRFFHNKLELWISALDILSKSEPAFPGGTENRWRLFAGLKYVGM